MARSKVKQWVDEILTSSGFNAELDNILDNALEVISPLTGTLDANGQKIILDGDQDTSIHASTDDIIDFEAQGFDVLKVDGQTASSVNGITIASSATGNPVLITMRGDDDRGMNFRALNGEEMLNLAATAAAVNEITITSADTGNNPTISCTGEANTGIDFENSEGEEILILDSVASSVNEVTISSAGTGVGPTITSSGETDVPLNITTAGTGALNLNTGGTGNIVVNAGATGTVDLGNAAVSWPNSDGAAANYALVTDGSATASFVSNVIATGTATSTLMPLPRSYLAGLQLAHDPDGDNEAEISIAAGECRNEASVNDTNMLLSSLLKKTIDTTWAAGDGGGLNATDFASGGSDAEANTWYYVFLIENGSGTVDAGFDKNIAATNLLSDSSYTKYRRIGAVRTDAAKDILDFVQYGDYFMWETVQDTAATTVSDANLQTLDLVYVPTGLNVEATVNVYFADGSDTIGYVQGGDGADVAASATTGAHTHAESATGGTRSGANQGRYWTDTSRQIQHRWNQAVTSFNVGVVGYLDRRGRDD
jgi:hypothetical protein